MDLRKARETRGLARWRLGEMVGVSESTVERWETGETIPTPEDVDRVGDALGDATIWHKWMLSHYDSYRKRYVGCTDMSLPLSVVRSRYALADVSALQDAVERDVIDGCMDDAALGTRYTDRIKSAIATLSDTLSRMEGRRGDA